MKGLENCRFPYFGKLTIFLLFYGKCPKWGHWKTADKKSNHWICEDTFRILWKIDDKKHLPQNSTCTFTAALLYQKKWSVMVFVEQDWEVDVQPWIEWSRMEWAAAVCNDSSCCKVGNFGWSCGISDSIIDGLQVWPICSKIWVLWSKVWLICNKIWILWSK